MAEFAWGALSTGFLKNMVLLDRLVQKTVSQVRNPWLDVFFQYVTLLGSPWLLIILGGLLTLYLLKHKKFLEGIFINIVLIITWIMVNYLKNLFARSRPIGETLIVAFGYSLPSGHAMISLSFYGFLAYLLWRKWPHRTGKAGVALLGFLILLVGSSRVYLNVHYASDVLAGYFFGGILLWLSIRCFRSLRREIAP